MIDGYQEWVVKDDALQNVGENFDGLNCPYIAYNLLSCGKEFLSKKIANIFLYFDECGVGVVSHELLHASLWAWKFSNLKQQYPIIINNMDEEEEVLHIHTDALRQFYIWYWKVEKYFKKINTMKAQLSLNHNIYEIWVDGKFINVINRLPLESKDLYTKRAEAEYSKYLDDLRNMKKGKSAKVIREDLI